MAHEINNPLGSMMQTTEVMRQRLLATLPANKRAAEACGLSLEILHAYLKVRGIPRMLGTVRDAGARAAAIVRNMLEFKHKSDESPSRHDIPQIMEQVLELARTDYDPQKKYDFRKLEIIRDYAPDLPSVPCDPRKFQQVMLNLLKNAAEAIWEAEENGRMMDIPRITLRTALEGDMVRVEVSDNGPGMSPEIRKRIFEPFFTTKEVGCGTGLGLSVSYFIIKEHHGGSMTVESESGKGATFVIRLPLTAGEVRDCPAPAGPG